MSWIQSSIMLRQRRLGHIPLDSARGGIDTQLWLDGRQRQTTVQVCGYPGQIESSPTFSRIASDLPWNLPAPSRDRSEYDPTASSGRCFSAGAAIGVRGPGTRDVARRAREVAPSD